MLEKHFDTAFLTVNGKIRILAYSKSSQEYGF